MKRSLSFLVFFLISFLLLSQTTKVLFIGNSLTYTNDLPNLVEREAKRQGYKLKSEMVAYPNYAIVDHWSDGRVQKMIRSGKYDYVIVQQGPSSQRQGKQMLLEDGAVLSKFCKRYDTILAYFMVWPSRTHYDTFEKVIENYRTAAGQNGALLFPVGAVWKSYFDRTADYSYYGSDGFHPSPKGSRVAARVIVDAIFNQ